MSKSISEYLINRKDNQYEVVIGLEVHAQVTSESKLFSSSSTKFGAEPNTQVSLVDAAFPGMLPVINEFCVKQAIKTGIGLNAKINKRSVFDRKNYFYADLPQGYQISQFKDPIVGEGKVILDMPEGQKEVGIERLHLEQDAGKSIHDVSLGGILIGISKMCIKGNIGIELKKPKSLLSEFEYFLSEDQGRYIIEISKSDIKKVTDILEKNAVHYDEIGILKGKTINFNEKTIVPIDELTSYNSNWLTNYMN